MNVKEYIQSGIVESYVLGLATEAERREFEQVCAEQPEILAARDAFERSLENQLMLDAVAPPTFIKEKFLEAVRPAAVDSGMQEEIMEAPVRRMNVWKMLAAACFVGLLGVGYWAYSTNEKYKDAVAKQSTIETQLKQSETALTSLQQEADILRHPMKTVALKGTDVAPQAQTTVYWDTTGANKDVYMVINNLPATPSEKQYQLWALMDGQPIDLGVFDYDVKQTKLVLKMKNVQKAQAFAITLEQKGRPNQDKPEGEMYVVGNL